jgi:hypothetical protein
MKGKQMPNIKDNMHTWDNDQIRDYYDQNPNLTILTYAGMLGLTGGELKDILMTDGSAVDKEEEATAEAMFQTEARTTRNYW